MTPDTIFRQASMTKPIVAVAALMLFEEGRFQLSDPISKWLPADTLEVCHPPVTRDERNDACYVAMAVVGRLVEVISGQSLDQFLSEQILRPLKMNDTYFYLPEGKLPRFAATYRPDANKKIELDEAPTTNSLFFRERTYFSGTGGLVSTASDYLRFQLMLLNGGELDGVRILGRKTVELMSSNHTGTLFVVNRGPGYGFGLGVSVLVDLGASGQLGSEGMFGWGGAFNTATFVDPKEDMIGIIMSQVRPNDHLNIRRDFQTLVYQALVSPQPSVESSK